METVICDSPAALGRYAGALAAARLNQALWEKGRARLLLATGQSQLELLSDLVGRTVAWERVEAFHLDEYVGIDPAHPASFRRYLRERVAEQVPLTLHEVDPSSPGGLERLGALYDEAPVDVALVGIGENGHIAFNDPPADLTTETPYLEVALDEACRAQQVGEGWFPSLAEVPERAVTMSVRAILRARAIVSAVPHAVKAEPVQRLFETRSPTPDLPASALLEHPDWTLVLDRASSRLLEEDALGRCVVL